MSHRYLQSEKQILLNSIGSEQCWGWSPAVDFAELLDSRRRAPAASTQKQRPPSSATLKSPKRREDNGASNKSDNVSHDEADVDALIRMIQERKHPTPDAAKASDSSPRGHGSTDASNSKEKDIHILLAGAADIRHIFRTLSSLRLREEARRAHKKDRGEEPPELPTYHFYLYEPNLRVHCRHLFFLQWLLDSMFSLEELEERVLMFLEVFGNSLIREITSAHSRRVVQRLLKGITSEEGPLMQLLSLSSMKLREKDFIEQQLTYWAQDSSTAPIEAQWRYRVQQDMAERYDNRDNLIDWDFVFKLTDYTNLLKFPEYRVWRTTGVAFDVCHINPRRGFEYTYNTPNKSLCHFSRRGAGTYCGDVKCGPFFALGAKTDNEHIRHRTADGTCKYGNGVVSMQNVRAWLYTLMTGLPWPWQDHQFAWDDAANYNPLPPGTPSGVEYRATFPKVCFHLLGLDSARLALHIREGREHPFDAAFVGTSCTQMMTRSFFNDTLQPHAVVIAETAKFVVDAEDSAKEAFVQKVHALGAAAGWRCEDDITAKLHRNQPAPPAYDGELTNAQKISLSRYNMPYQIALVKDHS